MDIYYVYQITNTIDNLTYVGCTKNSLKARMADHRSTAKRGRTSKLYRHMREVGPYRFNIELIESRACASLMVARMFEQEMINLFLPELNTIRSYSTTAQKKQTHIDNSRRASKKRQKIHVECACGGKFSLGNKFNHEKRTEMHLNWIKTNP